ncbi:uncharacterized protein BDZ99DRAFT_500969 [Mytilinidion resinicola]|uniref:Uncharacterized protein n=1 Tax=Mytilinidion resinicola TaxID=574789 RepID=A0A6A6YDY7_9PEZI|nr:uncharacterized protein BDZ99DRAFT_500969 [Mytilinidion resinicola]KAF2806950.1 hypothetical protein BDZ99DRAFT_500969 [Mytilinidion resinicola]
MTLITWSITSIVTLRLHIHSFFEICARASAIARYLFLDHGLELPSTHNTSNIPAIEARSLLLDLPGELRNSIYAAEFGEGCYLCVTFGSDRRLRVFPPNGDNNSNVATTLDGFKINHLLRRESRTFFYGKEFRFFEDGKSSRDVARAFLAAIGPRGRELNSGCNSYNLGSTTHTVHGHLRTDLELLA